MPSWGIGYVATKLREVLGLALLAGALLAATCPVPALGQAYPPEAVTPTAQEIQGWGFTVAEFQGLVQRTFELLKKDYQLSEQVGNPWISEMDDAALRREAVGKVGYELFMRRRYPTMPVERFRQGTHQRALDNAANQLFSSLEKGIAGKLRRLQIIEDAKSPTKQIEPPAQSSANEPQRTVRGTPGAGGGATPSGSGQIPAVEETAPARGPVKPNPNYQGPPLMDDPNLRGPWKPLGQTQAPTPDPWPNPNYQGPPVMDDPDLRGPWKPLDNKSPATTSPSAVLRHGPSILIVLDNIRTIQDCYDQGVAAQDCLKNLMVRNGIAVSLAAAAELIAAVPTVQLVIAGITTYYSASNIYDALTDAPGTARAGYEMWRAEREREDWLRKNMTVRDMPGYIAQLRQRIDDTLGPLAADMEARCKDLWQLASAAAPAADSVAAAMREMPEKSALLAMEPLYDRAMDALADERVLRRDLEQLRQAFAALGGDEASIAAFRQSAEALAGQARAHMAVEDELAAAKGTLDQAFALMARIRKLSAGAVPFERLEVLEQRIRQTRSTRAGQADRLRVEVRSLRLALPESEIPSDIKANLQTLDAGIDKHLHTDCNTADMIATHRAGAGSATDRLLDVQNSLEPVDLLHASLSRLAYGTGREILAAVQDMLDRLQPATATGGFQNEGASAQPGRHGQSPPEQPHQADSGFTSEGSDVSVRHDGGQRPFPSPDNGGFVDEGTVVGTGNVDLLDTSTTRHTPHPPAEQPSPPVRPPRSESVTYFERPWLPRSWQTSGDARQTRAEIYQAASRLGWAAALAEYAPATADNLVVDHLNATAGHLQRANQASFAPHKAWPDWQQRQQVYGQWIRRLTQGSAASRDYFRKGLDGLIRTEARTLREQLLTQTPRQAGGLSNCDSVLFDIGYDLAHAAQVQSIALDGMQAGKDRAWARQLLNKASASATRAGRNIQLIKPTPQQKGCPDYTVLAQELNQVKSRLNTAVQPELHAVWTQGLALAAGGGVSHDPDDLVGEWAISRDFYSWGGYAQRNANAPVLDPRQSGTVCVRIEARNGAYVGIISRQGVVPVVSDSWSGSDAGRQRLHLFHEGLEYLRLKKVGKNVFEGTIVDTGTPGDMRLSTKQVVIVVYGEAAKLLQNTSNLPREHFDRARKEGILMLRLDAGTPSATPDMEAAGRHVFSGIEPLAPAGARTLRTGVGQSQLDGVAVASYTFRFQKSFSFGSVTDGNPGVTMQLLYLGDSKRRGLDKCYTHDGLTLLQDEAFRRLDGEGRYCVNTHRHTREPVDYTLMSRLSWSRGDWVISLFAVDYPRHPGTQFHGQQGQMNYLFRLLDKLAPRLDTLPAPAEAGGTRLLGIQAR